MPVYTPVETVARRLNSTAEELDNLESFGWISTVEKNGIRYLPGHQEYKAKFVLHLLRIRKLTPQQISTVLIAEQPPYSLQDVDRILADSTRNSSV